MSRPKQSALKALRNNLVPNSRLLLAVSGGLDSVVMLHASSALSRRLRLHLEVAHVDHALRRDSAKDADFVRRLCLELGCPFHVKRLRPPKSGKNIEAWAREERYKFFSQILKQQSLHFVLTAHTANDVAETFLIKLLANKEPTSILAQDPQRHCLRPLLSVTRSEIENYSREHELEHVEDSTNKDTKFTRNRIRLEVLPILAEKFDQRIIETLSDRARAIQADIECLYELNGPAVARLGRSSFGSKTWLKEFVTELKACPPPLGWRLAEQVMKPKLGFNLGRPHAELLVDFALNHRQAIELPNGWRLKRKSGGLSIQKL